jgi:hypothetical protein
VSDEDNQQSVFADGRGGLFAASLAGIIVISFGLGAWFAGADMARHWDATEIIGVIAAIASTAAAIAAAYSAKFTRAGAEATQQSASAGSLSAEATRDTVIEMREARREEQQPRLTLERKFLDLSFVCPGGINGGPLFRARTQYDPVTYAHPHFELTNHSDAPALDVSAEFWLEDDNGCIEISTDFNNLGVRMFHSPSPSGQAGVETIMFGAPVGGGVGLPLYHRMAEYLPFCGPRQSRLINLPDGLMATLFARGLAYRERQLTDKPLRPMILIVTVACYTVAKDRVESSFRFETFPFCYGPGNPLEVHGHFRELPSNPIHDQRAS